MKRIISALLVICVLVCMAGCSKSAGLKKEDLVGKWTTEVDFNDIVKLMVENFDELAENEEFDGLDEDQLGIFEKMNLDVDLKACFEFDETTCTSNIDEASATQFATELMQAMINFMISEEGIETVVEMSGFTMEEFEAGLQTQGMTIEDYKEMIKSSYESMDPSEMFGESMFGIEDDVSNYEFKDGKLTMADEEGYWLIEKQGDDLLITEDTATYGLFTNAVLKKA